MLIPWYYPPQQVGGYSSMIFHFRHIMIVWISAARRFRKKKKVEEKGPQTRKQLDWKVKMDWFASFGLFEDVYKYWGSVQGLNIQQWTFGTTLHHNICPPASFGFFFSLRCSPLIPMQAAHILRRSYPTAWGSQSIRMIQVMCPVRISWCILHASDATQISGWSVTGRTPIVVWRLREVWFPLWSNWKMRNEVCHFSSQKAEDIRSLVHVV